MKNPRLLQTLKLRTTDQTVVIKAKVNKTSDADSDSLDNLDLASVQRQVRQKIVKRKYETMWQKTPARPNVRTRSENILSERPGVKFVAQGAKTESECWNFFITHNMLCKIKTFTNSYMRKRRSACEVLREHSIWVRFQFKNSKVPGTRKRCPSKRDKKTSHTCQACRIYICPDHLIPYCNNRSSSMALNDEVED